MKISAKKFASRAVRKFARYFVFCAVLLSAGLRAEEIGESRILASAVTCAPEKLKKKISGVVADVLGKGGEKFVGEMIALCDGVVKYVEMPRGERRRRLVDGENVGAFLIAQPGAKSDLNFNPLKQIAVVARCFDVQDGEDSPPALSGERDGWVLLAYNGDFPCDEKLARLMIDEVSVKRDCDATVTITAPLIAAINDKIRAARSDGSGEIADVGDGELANCDVRLSVKCDGDEIAAAISMQFMDGSSGARAVNFYRNSDARFYDIVPRDLTASRYNSWYRVSDCDAITMVDRLEKACNRRSGVARFGCTQRCNGDEKCVGGVEPCGGECADGDGCATCEGCGCRTPENAEFDGDVTHAIKFFVGNFIGAGMHASITKSGEFCMLVGARSDKNDSGPLPRKFRDFTASLKSHALKMERDKNYRGFEIYGIRDAEADGGKPFWFVAVGRDAMVVAGNVAGVERIRWLIDLYAARLKSKGPTFTNSKLEELEIDVPQTLSFLIAQHSKLKKSEARPLDELVNALGAAHLRVTGESYAKDGTLTSVTRVRTADLMDPLVRELFSDLFKMLDGPESGGGQRDGAAANGTGGGGEDGHGENECRGEGSDATAGNGSTGGNRQSEGVAVDGSGGQDSESGGGQRDGAAANGTGGGGEDGHGENECGGGSDATAGNGSTGGNRQSEGVEPRAVERRTEPEAGGSTK